MKTLAVPSSATAQNLYRQSKNLLSEGQEQEGLCRLREAVNAGSPEACYDYALILRKQKDPSWIKPLHTAAEETHVPSIRLLIATYKKEKERSLRLMADRWILRAYGNGINGYEFAVAKMLFEGLGFYSRLPLRHYNRKRAVEILLYAIDSPKRALAIGNMLLDARKPFRFHCKEDALLYPPAVPLPSSSVRSSPENAILWLERDECPEGYLRIAQFYVENKRTDEALCYFQKAKEKLGNRKLPSSYRSLEKLLATRLDNRSPEEKLAFLFYSEDPQERLQALKKARWAVTSEGYCRVMRESLESGAYDPEAREWSILYPLKEDIEALYQKYETICNK